MAEATSNEGKGGGGTAKKRVAAVLAIWAIVSAVFLPIVLWRLYVQSKEKAEAQEVCINLADQWGMYCQGSPDAERRECTAEYVLWRDKCRGLR